MTVGKGATPLCYTYVLNDSTDSTELQRCEKVKDLGVIIDSKLISDEHIQEKVNKYVGDNQEERWADGPTSIYNAL